MAASHGNGASVQEHGQYWYPPGGPASRLRRNSRVVQAINTRGGAWLSRAWRASKRATKHTVRRRNGQMAAAAGCSRPGCPCALQARPRRAARCGRSRPETTQRRRASRRCQPSSRLRRPLCRRRIRRRLWSCRLRRRPHRRPNHRPNHQMRRHQQQWPLRRRRRRTRRRRRRRRRPRARLTRAHANRVAARRRPAATAVPATSQSEPSLRSRPARCCLSSSSPFSPAASAGRRSGSRPSRRGRPPRCVPTPLPLLHPRSSASIRSCAHPAGPRGAGADADLFVDCCGRW